MKIPFLTGAIAGAVVITAGTAATGYHVYRAAHSATVISAKRLTRTVRIPRQECHDEAVTHARPVKDQDRLLGTGIGALVGGILGHQVGGGTGKTLATIAGAGAGGYAGNQIQRKVQQSDTYTTTEQRCITAYDLQEEPAGFDVLYEYKGHRHHLHMNKDPGDSLPVEDGKVVVGSLQTSPRPTDDR